MLLLIIMGCIILPSIAWIINIVIIMSIPKVLPFVKPIKTGITAPIYGPINGIIFVIPQINPSKSAPFKLNM